MFVTSRYTLDSASTAERAELGRLGVFLGAIRLPTRALASGGTSAVADIIVFRRRTSADEEHVSGLWLDPATIPASLAADDGHSTTVSPYFQAHPGMVLGEMRNRAGLRYGMTLDVILPAGADLPVALDGAAQDLIAVAQAGGYTWNPPVSVDAMTVAYPENDSGDGGVVERLDPAAEGAYTLHDDGTVTQQRDGARRDVRNPTAELVALIGLRDHAKALFDAEADQETGANARNRVRQAAMRAYKEYVAGFGYLGRSDLYTKPDPDGEPGDLITYRRRPGMGGFRADPDWVTCLALEIWDDGTQAGKPAPILLRAVNTRPHRKQHADNPGEALLLCLDECGHVDLDVIARYLDGDPADVPGLLAGQIWEDPDSGLLHDYGHVGRWVTADEYLSGNVRAKLDTARLAAARDPERWQAHVSALEAVQPEDLTPEQISVQLGNPWIPPEVIEQFICVLLKIRQGDRGCHVNVAFEPISATWVVRASTNTRKAPAATAEWGTSRCNAVDLIEDALNGVTPVVNDILPNKKTLKNREETALAADRIRGLQERFMEWLWEAPKRAAAMCLAVQRPVQQHPRPGV